MENRQKLELTWIGKNDELAVEPRILLYDREKSYGDENTENMLIHGDNLLALKALEQEYASKVKCIYIDPPYNTGYAFAQYDDNLEHSKWLSLMKPRIEILRNLLSDDGSIWISIDDDEGHYLKVLCDEIFGRQNFVNTVVWQKKYGPANDAKWLSDSHDFILVYTKHKESWRPNLLPRTEKQLKDYKNPDNDPRGRWRASDLSARTYSASCDYEIIGPTGNVFSPPPTRAWTVSKTRFEELVTDNRIWWGVNKDARPMSKKFLSEVKPGITPETWWPQDEVDDNKVAKYESKDLFDTSSFATPKPERLVERIVTLATNPGDLVLDSFLGSGTTAAVAHKMGRRWIGIELGDHCYTHCIPRLKKVVDGEQGGISQAQNWHGGGGFKFYELAPSLLKKDCYGNWVINERYNAEMLASSVAKLNGYRYNPDASCFWKQGVAAERSYIFTTTSYITVAYLSAIADEMAVGELLLVCCSAFDNGLDGRLDNITVKKIPLSVLNKCEYGVGSYNINIIETVDELDEDEGNEQ
ncbi:MAG: site-specific DNA-methyltransferase [bacterium]|nr:site-specific DNA-methyltransferase [bacterium]